MKVFNNQGTRSGNRKNSKVKNVFKSIEITGLKRSYRNAAILPITDDEDSFYVFGDA